MPSFVAGKVEVPTDMPRSENEQMSKESDESAAVVRDRSHGVIALLLLVASTTLSSGSPR
jgi:hypothetical protein